MFSECQRGFAVLYFLIGNIAYSSVGIFSCAKVDIFKKYCGQLLYAYYAGSLKGLALIYEQNTDEPEKRLKEVVYKCELGCSQTNIAALEWAEGNFKEMATTYWQLKKHGWNIIFKLLVIITISKSISTGLRLNIMRFY